QVAAFREDLGIRREARAADASNHLADLAQAHLALVGDRRVDRDAMHPRLGGSDWLPGGPFLVSALESVLNAVLGCRSIAQHRRERAEDLAVGGVVQPLEVGFVSSLVCACESACVVLR